MRRRLTGRSDSRAATPDGRRRRPDGSRLLAYGAAPAAAYRSPKLTSA
jgi:hypothetical protein